MGPWLRTTHEGPSWPYRHHLLFDVQRFQHGTGVRGAGLLDPPLGGAGRVDGGASTTVSGRNPRSIVVCGIFGVSAVSRFRMRYRYAVGKCNVHGGTVGRDGF